MTALVLLVLLAAPDKGIIPLDIVDVGTLKFGRRKGTPQAALAVWVEAHRLHKAQELPAACSKYIEFLGLTGHLSLPKRYAELARDRIEALHGPVRKEFEAACTSYRTDRAAGLAVWKRVARRWPMLPEGAASLQLWQSDALRAAIDVAKRLRDEGKKSEAAGPLEQAVRNLPHGLYRYEATTLLFEVGGPDLRPKKSRAGDEDEDEPRPKDPDDGESEIEIND